uniref:Uncharacterized protein n=1 Tax=Timema shepardi TaxID=629360 RepID=A0A7R9G3K9_TIMSH|nr:unnamed protein product [Timema shepardi]
MENIQSFQMKKISSRPLRSPPTLCATFTRVTLPVVRL